MAGKTKEELALISKGTQFTSENQPDNPGRKKKLPELDLLLAELLGSEEGTVDDSQAKEVFNALVKQAKNGNVQAAVAVLNRAYGMPKQAVDHTTNGKEIGQSPFSTLPIEKQEEILLMLQNASNTSNK